MIRLTPSLAPFLPGSGAKLLVAGLVATLTSMPTNRAA